MGTPPSIPEAGNGHNEYFTHPFPNAAALVTGATGGGMGTVFRREVSQRRQQIGTGQPLAPLHIFAMDAQQLEVCDAAVSVVPFRNAPEYREPANIGHYYREVFDDHLWWTVLHPNSITAAGQDPETLRQIFRLKCAGAVGTLDHALRYLDTHGTNAKVPGAKQMLDNMFGPATEMIPDGSVLHWSMHSMLPVMEQRADKLHQRGVYQTYCHHFPLPNSLIQHHEGVVALRAMSKMDAVYFHIDQDVAAFRRQIEMLRLPQPPIVGRFNLGIDETNIFDAGRRITRDNYAQEMHCYDKLDDRQKALVDMAAACEAKHQFVIGDRVDPHKGLSTLLQAIRLFLSRQGMDITRLREEFHFLCFHELNSFPEYEEDRIRHQYARYVNELYAELQRDFPGIFTVSSDLPAEAIPFLMRNRTLLNASNHDGLNLLSMEATAVNALDDLSDGDATVMVGTGAGYAAQAIADGFGNEGVWVEPGNVNAQANALQSIINIRHTSPGTFRRNMKALFHGFVKPRQGTVLLKPASIPSRLPV